MLIAKNSANQTCGIVPYSMPTRSICGIIFHYDVKETGMIQDVTCPECLRTYHWLKTGRASLFSVRCVQDCAAEEGAT
jgi:hypothetical protein